ncbi:MAG: MFS transporter [candidate division FCPU426 bacterium]
MVRHWIQRFSRTHPDLQFFLVGVALFGFSQSLVDSTFNNFLNDTFRLTDLQRSLLEVPRELPGLLVVFVSAALGFLCNRRRAVFAMFAMAAGVGLLGWAAWTYPVMLVWLFITSVGQHLFLPLNSAIGMELANVDRSGQRLGQLNAVKNLVIVLGSLFVLIGFKYLHFTFPLTFTLAALGFALAAWSIFRMRPNKPQPAAMHLKLYKEYRLFYWLNILYGTRKQIFITFAPWVLVTVYHQPTQMIALLLTLGGVAGIFFQPLLGKWVDTRGEKFVLSGEALLLIGVCLLYGFSGSWFPHSLALVVVCACFVADQLLMSVSMARATYLKKIALDPEHISQTLTAATSIDHVFSISMAVAGGVLWKLYGFQAVFLLGAIIALINLLSALRIVIPARTKTTIDLGETRPSV